MSEDNFIRFCSGFRMCLTDHPENRIPFRKSASYDETRYELPPRNYEAGFDDVPWINSRMPTRKTDTNNRSGFSTDFIGQNHDWPQGHGIAGYRLCQFARSLAGGWTAAGGAGCPSLIACESTVGAHGPVRPCKKAGCVTSVTSGNPPPP
ncbi:MAG: FAD-dependent oxidoreductase [Opitutaceae bacterium]|nr:FAD-dependent oxidoreductase [Opitutaceae bacterium]